MTPATFRKRRRGIFPGYDNQAGLYSQTVAVKSKASATGAAATGGNVATAGIGVAVDASTGAWDSLYPNPVSVRLVPQPGEHLPGADGLRAVMSHCNPGRARGNDPQSLHEATLRCARRAARIARA